LSIFTLYVDTVAINHNILKTLDILTFKIKTWTEKKQLDNLDVKSIIRGIQKNKLDK